MANSRRLPAARREAIEDLAWEARYNMGLMPYDYVPVARLIEVVLPTLIEDFDFRVTDQSLEGAEAVTHSTWPQITFSEAAYRKLVSDDWRARMTGLHEVGHLLLHTGQLSYAFQRDPKNHRNIEAEADLFAASFMMPECAFRLMTSISEAMKTFGVSKDAACHRARDLRMCHLINQSNQRKSLKKKGYGTNRTP